MSKSELKLARHLSAHTVTLTKICKSIIIILNNQRVRAVNINLKIINSETQTEDSSDTKNHISKEDLLKLYSVEFKSQSYASFYNTAMEKDKSILALSVAGIGFLITLLKLTDNIKSYDIIFFALATMSFLSTIYCVITLFGKNADFIVDLTQDKDVSLKQYKLSKLDLWAIRSFYVAIIMSILLGISTSSALFSKGLTTMSAPNNQLIVSTTDSPDTTTTSISNESYAQAQIISKSLQGAAALQPNSNLQQQPSSGNTSGAAAMRPQLSPTDSAD